MFNNVVITGASTGIGKACALHLAQLGFRVFAGVRKPVDGEALVQESFGTLIPIRIDVTQLNEVEQAVNHVARVVGDTGLCGLINNAGIVRAGPLEFMPLDELRYQINVNTIGQLAVTQAFLPLLRQCKGRIINMGSISGRVATPFLGPYAMSKFALRAMNDSLRVELRRWGLHVTLIEPGPIATPIWEKSIEQNLQIEFSPTANLFYKKAIQALPKSIRRTSQRAIPPEQVVLAVTHALTVPQPRSHYLVGTETQLAAWLVKWLPTYIRDLFVTR